MTPAFPAPARVKATFLGIGVAEGSSPSRGLPNYTGVITSPGSARAWSLLRAGVPLSLLCDLAEPAGPASREICTAEAVGADVAIDLVALEASRAEADRSGRCQYPERTA